MIKLTKKMVMQWVGDEDNNGYNEAINVLKEIANSKNDVRPWSPDILYKDIKQTWNENGEKNGK